MLNDQQTTYDCGRAGIHAAQLRRRISRPGDGAVRSERSLNNATIGLAAMVGFDRVAALARDAGIKNARGTPSMAIGSYDATPLDMAGAYTIFANSGMHLDPWMLASVRTPTGDLITDYTPTSRPGTRSARGFSDHQHDGKCAARPRHRRRVCATWDSPPPPPAKPAPATMHGLPDSPATCCASCGWATTTTQTSSWRAPMPPRPSGRSS